MVDDGWTKPLEPDNDSISSSPSAPGTSGPENWDNDDLESELENDFSRDFPNRLDSNTEPADELVEGVPDSEEEELMRYASIGERLTGVPMEKYVDDLYFESLPEREIAEAKMLERRDESGVIDSEITVSFDPEFRNVGDPIPDIGLSPEQIETIAQEYFHASGYNNDRARLMRDIGFTPYQTKKILEYDGNDEVEEEEAISEFLARTVNPYRSKILDAGFRDPYEEFVRSMVDYLGEEDALPEPERVSALKNDEEFGEQLDVEYVDTDEDHYIETGTYKDQEGEQESYALILGNNEATEIFRDYMSDHIDQIIEKDLEYIEDSDNSDDDEDWGEPEYLDPLDNYDFEEESDEYSLAQGPTAELYAPTVVIGGEMTESAPQEPSVSDGEYSPEGAVG